MTSDAPGTHIPEPVQKVVADLAGRAEHFVHSARNGGSWIEIYTWLLAMKPGYDMLYDIGMDGIRRTSRMTIEQARQDEIMHQFAVPDTIPDEGDSHDPDHH